MNDFKEWLSDYLRYFLLGFAILAVIIIAVAGIKVYQKFSDPAPKTQASGDVKVETETETDDKETENTSENNVKKNETESETEVTKTTEKATEKATESETATESESNTEAETSGSSERESENMTEPSSDGETEKKPEYLKTTTTLNFRSEPDGEVITSYGTGRLVKYLGQEGNWYKVRVGGRDGYMSAKYLEEVAYEAGMENEVETEPVTEAPVQAEPIYKVLKGDCYLRADTSKESQILGTYYAGTTIEFLEDVGGWYHVRVDGVTGYMGAQFF